MVTVVVVIAKRYLNGVLAARTALGRFKFEASGLSAEVKNSVENLVPRFFATIIAVSRFVVECEMVRRGRVWLAIRRGHLSGVARIG